MDGEWKELCKVGSEFEGNIVLSLLEQNGIEAIMRADLPHRVYPGLSPIDILVPEKDLDLAKELIENQLP